MMIDVATSSPSHSGRHVSLIYGRDRRSAPIGSQQLARCLNKVNAAAILVDGARLDHVRSTGLEAEDIGQALTRGIQQRSAVHVELVVLGAWRSRIIVLPVLVAAEAILVRTAVRLRLPLDLCVRRDKFISRAQGMELLQVKDRRLGRQEVLTHILLVIATLGFLLVDLIDKLLDSVRLVGTELGHLTIGCLT